MRVRFLLLVIVCVRHAHADPVHREGALEIFAHGRALAAENRCAEAIPLFLDTLKIEASVGALLNLAECHEKLGAIGEAYRRDHEAELLAHRTGDDRESLAHARASKLAVSLPSITINARVDTHVTIDGEWVETAHAFVAPPGDHVVRANEPGKVEWQQTLTTAGTETKTVDVPILEDAPKLVLHPSANASVGATQRTFGVIIAATGAVGLATGAVFGGIATARKSDAASLATGPSSIAFDDARSSAKMFADGSTALFVVGGVLAAAGLLIWIVAPRAQVAVTASTFRVQF